MPTGMVCLSAGTGNVLLCLSVSAVFVITNRDQKLLIHTRGFARIQNTHPDTELLQVVV